MIHHVQQILFHTEPPHQPVLNSSSINMNRYNIYQKKTFRIINLFSTCKKFKSIDHSVGIQNACLIRIPYRNTPSNLGQLGLCVQAFSYILNSCRPGRSTLHTLGVRYHAQGGAFMEHPDEKHGVFLCTIRS